MESTSWEVWSLRWAKWPARQPAGVSTGRWFDMTTLQSDGGAGEGWPQVSVCCQSSSNITGRSQSNDTAALSCNFVFTLGFWSANQRTAAVGSSGEAPCSYAACSAFSKTAGREMCLMWENNNDINDKCNWNSEHTSVSAAVVESVCLQNHRKVLWGLSQCRRGCLTPGPPSSFPRPQPSTPKQVPPSPNCCLRALIQQLTCNSQKIIIIIKKKQCAT